MDDGYRVNQTLYLCTESYTYEENKLLIDILKRNLDIKSSVHVHTSGHIIYIGSKERKINRTILFFILLL